MPLNSLGPLFEFRICTSFLFCVCCTFGILAKLKEMGFIYNLCQISRTLNCIIFFKEAKSAENPNSKTLSLPEKNVSPHITKASTLDDYDNIPIDGYGMAVLLGMGWSEDTGIGKRNKK